MDSENMKNTTVNTEFHKESSPLEPKGDIARVERYLSVLEIKLETIDQVNSKLISIKRDINELYVKLDAIENKPVKKGSVNTQRDGLDLSDGKINASQPSLEYLKIINKIDQNQIALVELEEQLRNISILESKPADLEMITEKLDTIEAVNEKLTDLLEITRNVSYSEPGNEAFLIEKISGKFQQLEDQLGILGEVKDQLGALGEVKEQIASLGEVKDQLKALDRIDEKLAMLEQISKRLSALEFANVGLSAAAIEENDEFEEEIPEGIEDEFEDDVLEAEIPEEEIPEEDKPLLQQIYDKLEMLEEISARLEVLEEINSRLDMLDEMDEQVNYIHEFMDDKLDLDYVAMYETLREEVHEDAIKTYRNIQAVIVEENAKQNHVLFGVDGNQDKLKFRMNHVMFFSIISFVTSILVMLLQILPALGIDLF